MLLYNKHEGCSDEQPFFIELSPDMNNNPSIYEWQNN